LCSWAVDIDDTGLFDRDSECLCRTGFGRAVVADFDGK
jgi:hypothetical protein